MSEQEAPNPLALELKDVLSKALAQWSDARYKKEDGNTEIPIDDVDAVMNGILNFTGINLALIHKGFMHMIDDSKTVFNYTMVHKYADHFMTIFLDNMELDNERTS